MQRLTGLDAAFLNIETPSNHMHVMAVSVLDPSTVEGGFTVESLRTLLEARIHRIPPFRRRLVRVPFGLHHPLWVEDPTFDLDYHVRRVAIPSPGGPQELADIAAEIAGWPLDKTRPLWQMWLVEGLEHGYVSLIAKVHHSALDGATGVDVLAELVDFEPLPVVAPETQAPWYPDRVPSDAEMIVGSFVSIARQPLRVVRTSRHVVRSALRLGQRIRNGPLHTGVPFTAPRLTWNNSITPHRKVAFASVSLEEVKQVKRAYGATVNDVVLALVGGALRRYLERRGELPDKPLVAAVPVSVRSEAGEAGGGNNAVSVMFTSLPTDLADATDRVRAVQEAMTGAKQVHSDIGEHTLEELADATAPALLSGGARLYGQLRIAERMRPILNLIVSNVPGPNFPLFIGGARLVRLYPMGPVLDGMGLNVTVMSYCGSVDVGFLACRENVPELWDLADEIPAAMADLLKAAAG